MSRIAIFIDGGYIEKVLNNELNAVRIDYSKLSNYIANCISPQIDLLRAYHYHCLPYQSNPPTPTEQALFAKKQKFFAALDGLPRFEVRYGRLERRGPDASGQYRYEQKLIDVLLSVDLVRFSATRQITHAALVAETPTSARQWMLPRWMGCLYGCFMDKTHTASCGKEPMSAR
ncbi:MAG: NYN domain-containing protein [Anaerolineae bacterium]|nr:NYN domain-containing protein [Anaerolineae bacterium]